MKAYHVNFYYVTREDFQWMNRNANKVDTKSFLSQVEPASRLFGMDRGEAIDRYYIDSFLKKECSKLSGVNKTIEVGELLYSRRFFPNALEPDVLDII